MATGPIRALIEGSPISTTSTPAQTAVSGTEGLILNANPFRKGLSIVNTGTTILYLSFGPVAPTTTAHHIPLKACTAANDGTGGAYVDDAYVGPVRAIGSAGGGTCVITEFTIGAPGLPVWIKAGDAGVSNG